MEGTAISNQNVSDRFDFVSDVFLALLFDQGS